MELIWPVIRCLWSHLHWLLPGVPARGEILCVELGSLYNYMYNVIKRVCKGDRCTEAADMYNQAYKTLSRGMVLFHYLYKRRHCCEEHRTPATEVVGLNLVRSYILSWSLQERSYQKWLIREHVSKSAWNKTNIFQVRFDLWPKYIHIKWFYKQYLKISMFICFYELS